MQTAVAGRSLSRGLKTLNTLVGLRMIDIASICLMLIAI
jgi:hypothetical protein